MPSIWYDKERGWLQKIAGTDQVMEMNGERAQRMKELAAQERAEGFAKTMNWDRDYSEYYKRLYGAGMNSESRPSFMRNAGGDNFDLSDYTQGSWRNQFHGRLQRIRDKDGAEDADFFSGQAGGGYGLHGFNELSSAGGRGYDVFTRNNAIMDLHRRGYSYHQIGDYIDGKRDIIKDGPDWEDYNKEYSDWYKGSLEEGQNPLTSGGPSGSFWGDSYFVGAPEQKTSPVNPLIEEGSSGESDLSTGKGFLGAYTDKRTEIEASKPSVASLFKEMEEYDAE